MNALVFTLRLLEPLLATQPQSGEANSATTLRYIPGSMVRGAVVKSALGGKAMDAGDPQAQRLFLSGAVQFLNAYLAHPASGERMLPLPLSWLVEKDEADKADVPIRDIANRDWELNNPKPPQKGRFAWHGEEGVQLGSPRLHVAIHTASLDRNRKVVGESQVYRYEALAAGQSFVGVIGTKDAGDLDLIKPWLETVERLGGAQTAGYGRVAVENIIRRDDWPEYIPATPAGTYVVVTLLSDLLLRDGGGNMTSAPGKALGITAEPLRAYRRLRVTGGFNRKWGLPLPQGWAIEAGSVFVYPAAGLDRHALKRATEQGIGERTAEGYGRIAIDWHTLASVTQCPLEKPLISRQPLPVMSAESKRLAQRMATRRLEIQLDRSLVAQIGEKMGPDGLFNNLPSSAQLSRARLAARQAWETGDLTVIDKHLTGLKSAANDWKRTRLRKWIEQQIQLDEASFLRQFDLAQAQGLPAVAEESTAMDAATWANLRAKTIARLIEGVLKQAVELKKQDREGDRP